MIDDWDELLSLCVAAMREHVFTDMHRCTCGYGPADADDWARHRMRAALEASVVSLAEPAYMRGARMGAEAILTEIESGQSAAQVRQRIATMRAAASAS